MSELDRLLRCLRAGQYAAHSTLNLRFRFHGPRLAQVLAEPKALPALQELDLAGNDLGVSGARLLCGAPFLHQLTSLDLGGNHIADRGVRALVEPPFRGLQSLLALSARRHQGPLLRRRRAPEALPDLGQSPYRDAPTPGARRDEADADEDQVPRFHRLRRLDLRGNSITQVGAVALASSPYLLALRELNLAANEVCVRGLRGLLSSPGLRALRSLGLSMNHLGDDGAQVLAAAPTLARLSFLDLSFNDISDEGLQALARSPGLQGIQALDLSHNRVSAAGLRALWASPYRGALAVLNLSRNQLRADDLLDFYQETGVRPPQGGASSSYEARYR